MSNEYLIDTGKKDEIRMDAMCKVFNGPSMAILSEYLADSFLDVGCGNGGLTHIYAEVNPGTCCLAIDRSAEQLEIAKSRKKLPNLEYVQADVHDFLKFPQEFHIVHTRFLLTHLKNPAETARSLLNLVCKGGYLIMIEADGGACNFSKFPRAAAAWKDAFTVQHVLQGSSLVTSPLLTREFPEAHVVHINGRFDTPEKKLAMSEGVRLACRILTSTATVPDAMNPAKKHGYVDLDDWIREADELVADPEFTFEMKPTAIIVKK